MALASRGPCPSAALHLPPLRYRGRPGCPQAHAQQAAGAEHHLMAPHVLHLRARARECRRLHRLLRCRPLLPSYQRAQGRHWRCRQRLCCSSPLPAALRAPAQAHCASTRVQLLRARRWGCCSAPRGHEARHQPHRWMRLRPRDQHQLQSHPQSQSPRGRPRAAAAPRRRRRRTRCRRRPDHRSGPSAHRPLPRPPQCRTAAVRHRRQAVRRPRRRFALHPHARDLPRVARVPAPHQPWFRRQGATLMTISDHAGRGSH